MLNHDSGMVALSGMPNDMRAVREAAAKGDERAKLALEIFTRSVKKAMGGFVALMGGVDAIVFAGGLGSMMRGRGRRFWVGWRILGFR